MIRVAATPDAFCFMAAHCALVIIDMQRDFIEPGGFGSALGNNVAPLREIIPAVERLLLLARRHAIQVIHTRESLTCRISLTVRQQNMSMDGRGCASAMRDRWDAS